MKHHLITSSPCSQASRTHLEKNHKHLSKVSTSDSLFLLPSLLWANSEVSRTPWAPSLLFPTLFRSLLVSTRRIWLDFQFEQKRKLILCRFWDSFCFLLFIHRQLFVLFCALLCILWAFSCFLLASFELVELSTFNPEAQPSATV